MLARLRPPGVHRYGSAAEGQCPRPRARAEHLQAAYRIPQPLARPGRGTGRARWALAARAGLHIRQRDPLTRENSIPTWWTPDQQPNAVAQPQCLAHAQILPPRVQVDFHRTPKNSSNPLWLTGGYAEKQVLLGKAVLAELLNYAAFAQEDDAVA
jgi:hypothetical protein